MGYIYRPFPLETWISRYFTSHGIIEPSDLEPSRISRAFRIYLTVTKRRNYAMEDGRFKTINLYDELSIEQQREVYFHELCHILRHTGFQYKMMP